MNTSATHAHGSRAAVVAAALLAMLSSGVLSACAHARSPVAVVDVMAIEQRWPKFINYYRQLQANLVTINESKIPQSEKQRELVQWRQQSQRWQDEVSGDVRNAVKQIADQRHYKMVVTKQGVDFGGDDITTDVEKALKIDTTASPIPGL